MHFTESLQMAASALRANKLRSFLTMLGIIIGNASVIATIGVGQGAQRLAAEEFESLGPNTIFVVPGTRSQRRTSFDLPRTLVLADAEAIAAQVPSVAAVAPQINGRYTVTYRGTTENLQVIGTTPDYLEVRAFAIGSGRFISDDDVQSSRRIAVLGSERAEKFFSDRDPLGELVRVNNISFEIVGVLQPKGSFLGTNQDDAIYLPLTTMAHQVVGRTSPYGTEVSFISVMARDEASISAAVFQIENLLRLRHNITLEDDFSVDTQKDVLDIVGTVTGGLTAMLAAIAGISLLVGGIGVMNIMLVSVTERTEEIGLRKAIGAREQDILVQFLIEATIVAALGGAIGTAVGIVGVGVVSATTPLKAGISGSAILLAVGVSGSIGLLFGVLPARRAAKLDPIVALRRL